MQLDRFAKYAWGVLSFNVFVILWGAMVRATGSGAGCGSHWPLCQGEVIPLSPPIETMIEFGHRVTSGVALLMVVGLLIGAYRLYPKGHHVRLGAGLSFIFMIIEALIGAVLVLFELVAYDTSMARVVVIALHLINTFILLSVLTLTAWWASGGKPLQFSGYGWFAGAIGVGFIGILIVGATGALTALGDTLFPASSLSEGLQQKYDPNAHFTVQLRGLHPLIAIMVGAYIVMVMHACLAKHSTLLAKRLTQSFTGLYVFQLLVGAFNVVLLAPMWMQLFHLLVSDILLIIFVLFIAVAFSERDSPEQVPNLQYQATALSK